MGLETGTYINSLIATNPVGATDPKSQGDDHLRLIKSTLLNTFPSITGAVTATHTAINQTCVGTGGTFPAINGSALTSLNATNLANGTVADARLSANIPLLNAANVFLDTQTISKAGNIGLTWVNTTGGVDSKRWDFYSDTTQLHFRTVNDAINSVAEWLTVTRSGLTVTSVALAGTAITLNGVAVSDFARLSQSNTFTGVTQTISAVNANWTLTDSALSTVLAANAGSSIGRVGTSTSHTFSLITNNTQRLDISSAGNFDFKGGTVTRNNASAQEVGYAGSPSRSISASDNTAATDTGKTIRLTGGTGQTFTLDSDPPTDSRVFIINESGNNWSIAASGTLTNVTATGTRTQANGCVIEAHHLGSGNWRVVFVYGTFT